MNKPIYGKIFTKEDAEELFGKVIKSVDMSTDEAINLLAKTDRYMMFNFVNDELIILNRNRKTIHGNYQPKSSEVFHVYRTSVFEELLAKYPNNKISFQLREKKFSVENGNFVMEMTDPCPPFCGFDTTDFKIAKTKKEQNITY
ncbi:MAG: hypothetical protein A2068_02160 [Ignavibacteria bacterium GWB2_35_6b]|nr:MAG: hypothetical protein A2068_02160 [Ignavibacteria bacterium GWB2_35_6b]